MFQPSASNQNLISLLFGYETDGGRTSKYWQQPSRLLQTMVSKSSSVKPIWSEYQAWLHEKREFHHEELCVGSWVKISDLGTSSQVTLFPDGTLTETALFQPRNTGEQGMWELTEGIVRFTIGEYQLDILANNDIPMHSGVEQEGNNPLPYAYFKVIHLQSETQPPFFLG